MCAQKYYLRINHSNIFKKAYLVCNNVSKILTHRKLPNDYQEVEWIESTGLNFRIDTGVKLDLAKPVRVEGIYLVPDISQRRLFFGTYAGSKNVNVELNGSSLLRLYMTGDRGLSEEPVTFNKKQKLIYSYAPSTNISNLSFGDILITSDFEQDEETENTVCLFNDTGHTNPAFRNIRIYSYKHIEDGECKCHLIPCYRKSDDVIGMYDLISKTFKENELSGIFTKGDNVY